MRALSVTLLVVLSLGDVVWNLETQACGSQTHTHTHILGILIISDRTQEDMCGLVVRGFSRESIKVVWSEINSRNFDRTCWRYVVF